MGESDFPFFKKNQLAFENIEAFYVEKDKFNLFNSSITGKILPDSTKKRFCRKLNWKPIYASTDGWKCDRGYPLFFSAFKTIEGGIS